MKDPTGPIYQVSFWRHPFRLTGLAIRRWTLKRLRAWQVRDDKNQTHPISGDFDGGDIPHELRHFTKGELLPFKGVFFRVGKVVGGPMPAIILVPVGHTKGTKLRTMRAFRERARQAKGA